MVIYMLIILSIRLSQCYSSSSHLRPYLITPLHFVCQNRREYAGCPGYDRLLVAQCIDFMAVLNVNN